MKHETQVRLIREAFEAIDRGSPPMAASFTRNDPTVYTSPERAAREREVLFRDYPIVAGFSCRVKNPGDFFADDLSPPSWWSEIARGSCARSPTSAAIADRSW